MKALSIKDPWASLIREGKKTIESRTWRTSFRGRLLLCCSALPVSPISGCAFAVADLVDCDMMCEEDEVKALCKLYPNAVSWILEDIEPILPFRVKGQLGLFNVNLPSGGLRYAKRFDVLGNPEVFYGD